ncbi:ABC transporter permease [Candidatus Pacearchaeota archaeon]|nr:ABC transporter permease [Candidatus Pacearchaeota archaeon]
MRNFLSCIQKDLRIIGRSRFSAFVALIIPLVVVLLVTIAFNSNKLHGVQVGVYSESYSPITNNIIKGFEDKSFTSVKEKSMEDCTNSVREGKNHICVVFPPELSSDGTNNTVQFYVDNSQINIAYALIDDVKTEISTASSAISLDLVNDLINRIQQAKKTLEEQKTSITAAAVGISSISESAGRAEDSIPNTARVITLLNDAKSSASELSDSGDIQAKLDDAINEAKKIDSSFNSTSSSIKSLKNESVLVQAKLDNLGGSLNGILQDLNSVKVTEAKKIVDPITPEIKPVVDESKSWNFLLPTLLVLMVLFGGTVLASIMASREKRGRAYFRNFITPTSDFTFLMAMYVSSLLILTLQFVLMFAGLTIATNAPVLNILGSASAILFISATAFIFLGLCIGHFFKSEEVVILVSLSAVSLMIFFSGIIVPIESILGQYQQFVAYNPVVIASNLLHRAILFQAPIKDLIPGLAILAGTVVVFFVFAFTARKATKRYI